MVMVSPVDRFTKTLAAAAQEHGDAGELGKVRVVVMEFAHGFHSRSDDADNPRIRWRYDPKQAGSSAVLADAGIHALHMGGYIIGQSVAEVSADFASCVPGRLLEDDAALQIRFSDGAIGRLWTSAITLQQKDELQRLLLLPEGDRVSLLDQIRSGPTRISDIWLCRIRGVGCLP